MVHTHLRRDASHQIRCSILMHEATKSWVPMFGFENARFFSVTGAPPEPVTFRLCSGLSCTFSVSVSFALELETVPVQGGMIRCVFLLTCRCHDVVPQYLILVLPKDFRLFTTCHHLVGEEGEERWVDLSELLSKYSVFCLTTQQPHFLTQTQPHFLTHFGAFRDVTKKS